MWELASLPDGTGWVDSDEAARWMAHRHGTVAVAPAIEQCITEATIVGLVGDTAPVGLTPLGRLALTDPNQVRSADLGGAGEVIVQADLTVVAPPDLDPSIRARLALVGDLESDAGAIVYRLADEPITRAVQGGQSAEEICAFLDEISSVSVPGTVRQFVVDAASRAGRVKILSPATIVVTTDPVDLATACSLKSAKLQQIAPTVAISTLSPDKLRDVLDRRGLSPDLVLDSTGERTVRRSGLEAAQLRRRAEQAMDMAKRANNSHLKAHAASMLAEADQASNPSLRLTVSGPLAVTPQSLAALGPRR